MSTPEGVGANKDLAAAFRALADPFRLRVYRMLLEAEGMAGQENGVPLDMSDVVEHVTYLTNMSPSVVEHHLLDLARARLAIIEEGEDGRPRVALNHEMVADLRALMEPGSDA